MSCQLIKVGKELVETCSKPVDSKLKEATIELEGGPLHALLCDAKCFFQYADSQYNAYMNICQCTPKYNPLFLNYRGR